ncbi:hypothetical protein BH20ACI1_BH20ACI1_18250 [soil metagenome]
MGQNAIIEIEIPSSIRQFKLPKGVNNRLQDLLDRQDSGKILSDAEKSEAEGLVDLAEMLSLLNLRSKRVRRES